MTGASAAQIGAIHTISKAIGMSEAERRDLMATTAGKRSARELSAGEAIRVINRLREIQGGAADAPRPSKGAKELTGKWAPLLRALWLSAYNLAVVDDRTDRALIAFVKRQTGLDSERWLVSAADARKVIEALKSWLERTAGVEWPASQDVLLSKRAVHRAQTRRLIAAGFPLVDEAPDARLTAAELDADIAARGAALRRALRGRK
ncbi:regulatory protein GemA [Aquabacter cavernae]|uniref:regulatory protein GemA n=1 Tax=Aquabacter cavernae TaxID=2496029 RepID=UPI000F8E3E1E|nr:regulatory protein GemA [Aquabacter cavernae]